MYFCICLLEKGWMYIDKKKMFSLRITYLIPFKYHKNQQQNYASPLKSLSHNWNDMNMLKLLFR